MTQFQFNNALVGIQEKHIHSLEDDLRIPFLKFLDGFKYKEIAEEMNLPIGTVKSRIFYARRVLKLKTG
ncbi:MAG: hypothetical protein K0B11_17000 [Mariniphaga sp.]|nr:hypothetical protein [Mariniphaga sp.]